MTRVEILKSKADKEKNSDFLSVGKKDQAVINALKSKAELELIDAEQFVDDWIADPNLSLDDQFLALYAKLKKAQERIDLLNEIEAKYL
jgi:hypothetical protein